MEKTSKRVTALRFNLLMKLNNVTVFFMISNTQTLEGITSKVGEDEHIILWDVENCTVEQAMETLTDVQYEHKLGDIFIVSDAEGSYRGWCFSRRTWKEYLIILLKTKHLDYNFWYWTVGRGKATLRISNKLGRQQQRVVAFLEGYEDTQIPERLTHVFYDTGIEKRGVVVKLGRIPIGVQKI